MKKIDITPTPDGLRHIIKMLNREMESADDNMAVADDMVRMLDDLTAPIKVYHGNDYGTHTVLSDDQVRILRTALEMYVASEDKRLLSLAEGVAECYKGLGEEA